MARAMYGPQPAFGADNKLAISQTGGLITFDREQTSTCEDIAATPTGDAMGTASSDSRGAVLLWGPDNYEGLLWQDFGSGPFPLFPTILLESLLLDVAAGSVADGGITEPKVATDAVGARAIAAGAVGADELADEAVTPEKLAAAAVTAEKLAPDSVTADSIAGGAVGAAELAAGAVTAAKVADDSLTPGKLAGGTAAAAGTQPVKNAAGTGWDWTVPGAGAVGTMATPKTYGAKGDLRYVRATTTAGSATAIITGGPVSAADVGKLIAIGLPHLGDSAAGTNGHLARIGSVNAGAGTVSMVALTGSIPGAAAKNATTSVSSGRCLIGTDDTAAFVSGLAALSTAGGGTLRGDPGCKYLVQQSLKAVDGVVLSDMWLAARFDGNPQNMQKSCVVPGFVHGDAMNITSNPAGAYPHYPIADVAKGTTTITGTTSGQITASPLVPGMIAWFRSTAHNTQSTTEIPHRLFGSRILTKVGDVLTIADPAPFDITTAVHGASYAIYIDPSKSSTVGAPTWTVQRSGCVRMVMDAQHPHWGGGAYEWISEDISSPPDMRWSECITLNSMCHSVFRRWPDARWSYTAVEIKLGSGWTLVEQVSGRYDNTGGTVYSPVSIGESAHNIEFRDCDLQLPFAFSDTGKMFAEIYNCTDVDFHHNTLRCDAEKADAIITIATTTLPSYAVDGVSIHDNDIRTYASGTVGCARVFKIGQVSIGSESAAALHKNVSIYGNSHTGLLRTDVNELVYAACVSGFYFADNSSDSAAQWNLGGRLSGTFKGGALKGSDGLAAALMTTSGWIDYTAGNTGVNFGQILPNTALIMSVLVEVQTAFNGTGSNTLKVGHNALDTTFVTGVPAGVAQAIRYDGGSAAPTAGGSIGSGLGKRLGGMSATSQRRPTVTYNGTGATTGKALVTITYTLGSAAR